MWIEEGIRDLKQYLKWETYTKKIPQNNRLQKLIIISLISYVIGLCVGIQKEQKEKKEKEREEEQKKQRYKREGLYRRFKNMINSGIRNLEKSIWLIVVLTLQHFYRIQGRWW